MTKKQVASMIASLKIPYAYYQFDEGTGQAPPFICFFYTSSDDLYADQSNYQKITGLSVELYTAEKDFDLEDTVEALLNDNGLTYYKEENYIDSEKMFMTSYDMQVLITEGE